MERHLGLPRDPFAPTADAELYWENDALAELRRRFAAILRQGGGVRVAGAPGSGRRSLLLRVAGDLAAEGVPVALCEAGEAATAESFLASLAAVVGAAPLPAADRLTLAEHLYRRLVEVFCAARAAVVVLPWAPTGAVAEEVGILAELRLLGRPLVAVAALDAPPPLADGGATVLQVPAVDEDDLRDCLAHRAAAVGRADLLSPSELAGCLAGTPGLPVALGRARAALRAQVFAAALGAPRQAVGVPPPPVLDLDQVQEVSRLLAALTPEFP